MNKYLIFSLSLPLAVNVAFAETISKTVTLTGMPDYHRESCFKAKKNDTLRATLNSPEEIGFGIHWHTGGIRDTETHHLISYHQAKNQSYLVIIPEDAHYCFDFTNLVEEYGSPSVDVTIDYTLSKSDI